jgi:methylated-DNA-[protein]-cysteine S-methyltransferase
MSVFSNRVYTVISRIPKGKVTTYKAVAHALHTRAYQAVGRALRDNPYAPMIPCHRVVASDGTLHGFMGKTDKRALSKKKQLLEKEGIRMRSNIIMDFKKVCVADLSSLLE